MAEHGLCARIVLIVQPVYQVAHCLKEGNEPLRLFRRFIFNTVFLPKIQIVHIIHGFPYQFAQILGPIPYKRLSRCHCRPVVFGIEIEEPVCYSVQFLFCVTFLAGCNNYIISLQGGNDPHAADEQQLLQNLLQSRQRCYFRPDILCFLKGLTLRVHVKSRKHHVPLSRKNTCQRQAPIGRTQAGIFRDGAHLLEKVSHPQVDQELLLFLRRLFLTL